VHVQGTFDAQSGNVRCTIGERSAHIRGTFWEHSRNIVGTLSAQSGNVQCTIGERSAHIRGTFSAYSGNVRCAFRVMFSEPTCTRPVPKSKPGGNLVRATSEAERYTYTLSILVRYGTCTCTDTAFYTYGAEGTDMTEDAQDRL
jgi:hypothetical protein